MSHVIVFSSFGLLHDVTLLHLDSGPHVYHELSANFEHEPTPAEVVLMMILILINF